MFIPTLNFTQTCLPTQHYFFSLFKTFRVQGVSSKLISIKLPEVSAHETTSLLPTPNSLPSHKFLSTKWFKFGPTRIVPFRWLFPQITAVWAACSVPMLTSGVVRWGVPEVCGAGRAMLRGIIVHRHWRIPRSVFFHLPPSSCAY